MSLRRWMRRLRDASEMHPCRLGIDEHLTWEEHITIEYMEVEIVGETTINNNQFGD